MTAPEPTPGQRGRQAEEAKHEFDGWFAAQGLDDDGLFSSDEMQFAFESGMQAERDLDAAREPKPAPELRAAMAETRAMRDLFDQATRAVLTKRWALTESEKLIIRGFRSQAGLPPLEGK